jgi:ubiquinone/menaquinone biosynthesis C-methylase UbiE
MRMTLRRSVRPLAAPTIAAVALLAASAALAQNNAADTETLIKLLQLKPGHVVAEIGAGGGELTIALAKHVAPNGRVLTSELGDERLAKLRGAVEKSGVSNVQVIEGQAAHANLADACCDALFMRNVYHHFVDPTTMNASFIRALKPGGRLVVIDFPPRNNAATAPPGKRGEDAAHGVTAEVVASELKAAGLNIISTEDRGNRWFLVLAQKP